MEMQAVPVSHVRRIPARADRPVTARPDSFADNLLSAITGMEHRGVGLGPAMPESSSVLVASTGRALSVSISVLE